MEPSSVTPPIAKVGAVLVREDGRVFVLRPKPKNPGESTKFVLPRGSRQYLAPNGVWTDARDPETALQHAERLEPVYSTLVREMGEEAGLPLHHFTDDSVDVTELGSRAFTSETKGSYPIHWFALKPDAAAVAAMDATVPGDAEEWGWKTFDEIKALAAMGDFSPGYLPVIEEVLRVTRQHSTQAQSRRDAAPRGL